MDVKLSGFSDATLYQAACMIEEESGDDLRSLFLSLDKRLELKSRLDNDPRVRALKYIQGELSTSMTEDTWAELRQENPGNFANAVQGRLSQDLLMEKLVYLPKDGIGTESAKLSKSLLETWIRKQDLKTLSEFVLAVTGFLAGFLRP